MSFPVFPSALARAIAVFFALFLGFAALAQTPHVRIMPMGDSITFGSGAPGGYRNKLYALLTAAGYNVDFVGTQTGNGVAALPDSHHQGHSGWRIDQLDSNVAGWFAAIADPDVILLHIGTNDFGQGVDISNAINRLDALITKMAQFRPYAHIIVTNLMERAEPHNTNIQTLFNPFVQARVNAQAALGRRVTFLDMRSAVPLAEMPDNLHPNQAGYDHMADAWLPAIQAVITPLGDSFPPAIARAQGTTRTEVAVTFSKPVADSAANPANFSLSGGLTVLGAVLDASKRIVTLTTTEQAVGVSYTATVNGITDRTAAALTLSANSTIPFSSATPRGYLNNIPESAGYTLAYSLDIPALASYGAAAPAYSVDNRNAIGPFSRVAYYLELQALNGDLKYVWASVDAFTSDASKIAVPTAASGAVFQQAVTGMNVFSNVAGLTTGTGLAGNLEFWPNSYSGANATVPSASPTLYDFGDTRSTTGTYGSMQLHNTAAGQTVFAFNNWGATTGTQGNADLGIGNDPAPVSGGVDWTFHKNAGDYVVKTLQVLVQNSGDTTRPTLVSATSFFGRTRVLLRFSEPVLPASLNALNLSLDGGVTILGVNLLANQREAVLTTTTQPAGTPLTLTVSGVRDSSPAANLILPGSTIPVQPGAPPALAAVIPEAADYQLVYSLNLPAAGNLVSGAGFTPYSTDNSATTGAFSRVAYYMELQKTGDAQPRHIWVSMDAFTTSVGRIGVPTPASGAVFQQNVSNLNVFSNVPGVVNGTGITTGNIEFWPNNYSQANAVAVPGARAYTFDFGDTRSTTGSHGSMQVHNHGAAQTLFALSNWGTAGNSTNVLSMGIGNNPTAGQSPDYTQTNNGTSWDVRRVLQVYVLPDNTDSAPPTITRVTGSTTLNRLAVTFSEPVADGAAQAANFSIPGLNVTGATLLAGQREIALTTSAQTPGNVYTVNVTGIRDRSPAGNLILAGASATFTAHTPPPILATIPEAAGYSLVYQLAIPSATPQWNLNAIPYAVDEARFGGQPFDRVAYLLELDGNWAFASFDRHTALISQVGVPTLGVSATAFQQKVTNLTVASNVAGIVTGTNLTGGNIEFWGGNYSAANALGIPGASATLNDFGDTMSAGGHGSLQVHNHGAGQTILAYNNWGSTAGQISALGLGNNPNAGTTGVPSGTQGTDWTFAGNAGSFTTRSLYVLIRPAAVGGGPAPELLSQPISRRVDLDGTTTLAIAVNGTGPFTYQWRFNGQPLSGETNPWLVLTPSALNQTGPYDVVVTSPTFASTTSQPATLTVNTPQETWRRLNFGSLEATGPAADTANPDGDSLGNLLEFAFGTDPTSAASGLGSLSLSAGAITRLGQPVVLTGAADRAVFARRKNRAAAGLTYAVQFSADLISWETSSETPAVLAADAEVEAVAVPFPTLLGNGRQPQFFRVVVGAP